MVAQNQSNGLVLGPKVVFLLVSIVIFALGDGLFQPSMNATKILEVPD